MASMAWMVAQDGDPWARPDMGRRSPRAVDDRVGGNDKIAVPEFSGEEDKDGLATRRYLRKIAAWQRMTRLRPAKQALALYNNLSGRAWRDAEEIDLTYLDDDAGAAYFTKWVADKYLPKEVVKVGKCMLEFFRVLKKQPSQDIREFNQEYDRQVSRLKEVGCIFQTSTWHGSTWTSCAWTTAQNSTCCHRPAIGMI